MRLASCSFALAFALAAVVLSAQARPEVKLPPSPRGSAETQVLGKYVKGRYEGGQWITVDFEQLTIGFSDARTDGGSLFIAWDRTMGAVSFTAK